MLNLDRLQKQITDLGLFTSGHISLGIGFLARDDSSLAGDFILQVIFRGAVVYQRALPHNVEFYTGDTSALEKECIIGATQAIDSLNDPNGLPPVECCQFCSQAPTARLNRRQENWDIKCESCNILMSGEEYPTLAHFVEGWNSTVGGSK